jgi:hypothetical protein
MKYKKTATILVFLLLGLGSAEAQVAEAASGGDASGPEGSVSYSVGQVFYVSATGENGSLSSGVQQPYEISSVLGIEDKSISLELSVYPNPTADYLTLKVEETTDLTYQLFNIQGIMISNERISSHATEIDLASQPSAAYFLTVFKENKKVKTFKIIKNN